MVDHVHWDIARTTGVGDRTVDVGVIRCRDRQVGAVDVAVLIVAGQVGNAALVIESVQIGAESWCDDPDPGAGTQQQGDLARGDLAAADHGADLVFHGQEYRQMLHGPISHLVVDIAGTLRR